MFGSLGLRLETSGSQSFGVTCVPFARDSALIGAGLDDRLNADAALSAPPIPTWRKQRGAIRRCRRMHFMAKQVFEYSGKKWCRLEDSNL